MDTFKQLKIIYFALAAGQVSYFIIVLVLIQRELVMLDKDYSTIWGFIVPVLVVIMVVISRFLYNRMINIKAGNSTREEKLNTFRSANIVKFALLEGANFLSITFYLLTGDFLYAGIFVIVMGIFLVNFPGKERFIAEFGLSSYND